MTAAERLSSARRLFLDTAPVIYYVEENPLYIGILDNIFDRLDRGVLSAVTSPITLAESLVLSFRTGRNDLVHTFTSLLSGGPGTTFVMIGKQAALDAADLRARYNLTLGDSFQAALARSTGCDALLTNDAELKRVKELNVVVLGDLLAG